MIMDDVFAVIAEGTRREILARLRSGDRSVGQLVEELKVSQPTISKHLKVLREAGLVSMRAQGQKRYYTLETAPLRGIAEWLDSFARNDPRLADRGSPARKESSTTDPGRPAAGVPADGAPPPEEVAGARSEILAAAALAVPGTDADSARAVNPGQPARLGLDSADGLHAGADNDGDAGPPAPLEGTTRPQHLGRTVGRAAERAADLLSQLRRRRDQER
ncbi:ArsR/SmtB family transcription factor [Arthrobacter sp. H41]|uniref:ArsR/SmtB family transcription factor n=1 Tax=Arthrobacter sp. H41 TaxID=1312978 RepID=UPI00047E077D|nr:metalloregulator ArsR/SmtB family transcription factor [Arthrobacter sp. H41]